MKKILLELWDNQRKFLFTNLLFCNYEKFQIIPILHIPLSTLDKQKIYSSK